MMHKEVSEFILRMRDTHPALFAGFQRVIEMGSYDINGTPRKFFRKKVKYVGVDWRKGPGVDAVSLAHAYRGHPDGYFDLAISTEMLEHDPHWNASLDRIIELLAPGGCILITCAGPGRHKHDVGTSPSLAYYENPTMVSLVTRILYSTRFKGVHLEDDLKAKDLRLFAWRKAK